MPTYEVFLKKDGKDEFRHAGALDAANNDLAMVLARECYVRRAEGDRIWLVDRANVIDADPDYLEPNADKPHRHHDGQAVAAHRKAARAGGAEDAAARAGGAEDAAARAGGAEDAAARAGGAEDAAAAGDGSA